MNKEELSSEDILNATGSLLNIMTDYVDNSHKEIEELEKENTNLKQKLNEIKEYCNNPFNWKYTDHYLEKDDILQIIDKVGGNE